MFSNVDVLTQDKKRELICRLQELDVGDKPDVIALQEVRPKNSRLERELAEYCLDGFELYEKNVAETDKGRGLLVYVRRELFVIEVEMSQQYCEYLCIEVKCKSGSVLIASIYRSPNTCGEGNDNLLKVMEEICNKDTKYKVLLGDYNMPMINWTNYTTPMGQGSLECRFIEKVRDCFLIQHITEITRYREGTQGSVLDLLFSSEEEIICDINVESPIGRSDHACISFNCDIKTEKDIRSKRVYMYDRVDYKLLRQCLDMNWKQYLEGEDADGMWRKIRGKLESVISICVPEREYKDKGKLRKRTNPELPMNRKLWKLVKRKKRLWTRLKELKENNGSHAETREVDLERRRVNNKIRWETRKGVKEKERKIAKNAKDNPKIFWKYIQDKMTRRVRIPELVRDLDEMTRTKAETDREKADLLGKYFGEVFTVETEEDIPSLPIKQVPTLELIELSQDKILGAIKKMKSSKSPGPDGIHPRIIKEGGEILVEPFRILFEESFRAGQIPTDWKTANVTAIFKKGKRNDPGNYRPVSLTCVVCKLMETIVREEVMEHMKSNKLFSRRQFGFLPGRSTVLQLVQVIDDWVQIMEEGGVVDVIYCDFMKAFDKVPHKRLIEKVKSYNIGVKCVKWIEEFLKDRRQRVLVNGICSDWSGVTSGVPQGSVLGPLLFVIFINDLPDTISNESKIYLYADDTKIYRGIRGVDDMERLQRDVDGMKVWSEQWLLPFHPMKCKYMRIGSKAISKTGYCMHEPMEEVGVEKDIGVVMDNKLNFSDHLAEKINKANKIVGLIRRTFVSLEEESFRNLYISLVRPHLEYANQVWAPYKVKDIEAVEGVQRRASKLVPSLKNLNYEQRLRKLGLPTLTYRRMRGDMIETYKIVTGKYDEDVCEGIFLMRDGQGTRGHTKKIYKERARLDKTKHSFCYRVVNEWNALPQYVIDSNTVAEFERNLDKAWENQELKFNYKEKVQHNKTLSSQPPPPQ